MNLAIFDLDNTLLSGDSDFLWGQFLAENNIVQPAEYEEANAVFFAQYNAGTLNIGEYLSFALKILARHPVERLSNLRKQFLNDVIRPRINQKALDLVTKHRQVGDTLLIITATNRFITAPIAAEFGIPNLLANEPEIIGGAFTGQAVAPYCFKDGKIEHLERWVTTFGCTPEKSYFYSDSHNDIPLLNYVDHPITVDPDDILRAHALEQQWPILNIHE